MSLPASESWLLADKLRVPRLSDDVRRRDRVTRLIDQAVRQRVTLITGPVGSGKTVACASWAASAARRRRVAWLTVDGADRAPARFWAHVAAALDGDTAPAHPVVLMLDDIHKLAGSEAAGSLDLLVHHAPPAMRLILSGRFAPGLQLAKLRLGGELAALGEAELACTEDEAEACFGTLGLAADPAERVALLGRTEGWMAGLRLSTQDSAIAADYLRDEILGPQSTPVQEFMLRASLAGELTAELGDHLTGEPGSGRILDRLSRENSFVCQVGEERYRFHPFVADLLTAELRRQSPEIIPELLGNIADWHAVRGETTSAARFAADAGDWVLAARLLADGGLTGLLPERAPELAAALSQLPAEVRHADPATDAALAAAWLSMGEPDAAAAPLNQAERAVVRAAPALPELELWLAALRVMGEPVAAAAAAATGRGLAHEHAAVAGTPAEQRSLGVLWLALGTAALRRHDGPAAGAALRHAERRFAMAGPAAMRERAGGWRGLTEAFGGDLVAAEAALAGLSRTDPATDCLAALTAAQCALDRDELAAAATFLGTARSVPFAALPGEPDPWLLGELIGARVRLADGDVSGARAALARLREHPEAVRGMTDVLAADIALQADGPPRHDQHDSPLAQGRVLFARGDAAGALAVAECHLDDGTPRDRLVALLLAVVAQRRLGAPDAATGLLQQALMLAEPHRMCRPFLDGGTPVRSAMTVLTRPESHVAGFAARVLQRFSYQAPAGHRRGGHVAPLSGSELAVLRFLASHLTNQEIAEALCLSVNTVKTHLRTAYRKLGVTSRRAAIARGERLGLL